MFVLSLFPLGRQVGKLSAITNGVLVKKRRLQESGMILEK